MLALGTAHCLSFLSDTHAPYKWVQQSERIVDDSGTLFSSVCVHDMLEQELHCFNTYFNMSRRVSCCDQSQVTINGFQFPIYCLSHCLLYSSFYFYAVLLLLYSCLLSFPTVSICHLHCSFEHGAGIRKQKVDTETTHSQTLLSVFSFFSCYFSLFSRISSLCSLSVV